MSPVFERNLFKLNQWLLISFLVAFCTSLGLALLAYWAPTISQSSALFMFWAALVVALPILEISMGVVQWLHSLYLGWKMGSRWHICYSVFAVVFLLVLVAVCYLFVSPQGSIYERLVSMVPIWVLAPAVLAIGYTLYNQHYLSMPENSYF